MTEDERIGRLTSILEGTGAKAINAFGIWALDSQLADHHMAQLAGWADLRYLVAGSCKITDASMGSICGFRNLTDLSIGGNTIFSTSLASSDLPPAIRSLGLYSITLADDAVESLCRCHNLTVLNVNHCNLSRRALTRLSDLPNLRVIEALGADSTPDTARILSRRHPKILFRLRDGLWQNGECRRPPFPGERA